MTDIGAKLEQLDKRLKRMERAPRLSSASLDNAALEVRDGIGSLRALVGQQSDGTTAVNVVNGGPPPSPSTPSAGPALGGISAGWDGTLTNGAVIPLDWSRVEVHASPTAGFTPSASTLQATIETPQGGLVYVPATAPMYVCLVARNTSGAASTPSQTVGPYAPRPVAGDIGVGEITATLIADGAVTTPKILANAVITSKLAAGSVDATAIKADALTGKTITGGSITGATVTGGTVRTSATGQRVVLTPSGADSAPAIELWSGSSGEVYPSSLFAQVITEDGVTAAHTYLSTASSGSGEAALKLIAPTSSSQGSAELLIEDGPSIGINGTEKTATIGVPDTSGTPVYYSFGATAAYIPVDFRVAGKLFADELAVTKTTFATYTPTVLGGGTATYNYRTGWYYKLGSMIYFTAEFNVNAAGSGTTPITITAPTAIYRGTRHIFLTHAQSIYTSGLLANGTSIALETGTGSTIDRISVSNNSSTNRDNILQGGLMPTAATVTVQGWYREA